MHGKTQKPAIAPDVFQSRKLKPQNQPVLDAWSEELIRASAGQMATVIGRITEVFHGISKNGETHIFVNFGDWQKDCFTAVLWGQVLEDLDRFDIQIDAWPGKWMSVTGLLAVINNRPQMQIESITDLLPMASEENAKMLLQSAAKEGRYRRNSSSTSSLIPLAHKKELNIVPPQKVELKKTAREKVGISDIFEKSRNPLVETALNMLYSKEHFTGGQK
jgi:hypothetical protein